MKGDIDSIIQHLNVTWGSKECPMCGRKDWHVGDTIFELREHHGPVFTITFKGPILPVIPITCGNCGLVNLINPVLAKIEIKKSSKKSNNHKKEDSS